MLETEPPIQCQLIFANAIANPEILRTVEVHIVIDKYEDAHDQLQPTSREALSILLHLEQAQSLHVLLGSVLDDLLT